MIGTVSAAFGGHQRFSHAAPNVIFLGGIINYLIDSERARAISSSDALYSCASLSRVARNTRNIPRLMGAGRRRKSSRRLDLGSMF